MKKLSLLSVIVILLIAQGISVLGAREATLVSAPLGYQPQTGEAVVLNHDSPRDTTHLPPCSVRATEVDGDLTVTWLVPGTPGGDWFSYCGPKGNAVGTDMPTSFDVAIRYAADALSDYAGMSLQAVRVWPADVGTFAIRVWVGGGTNHPGLRVVNQAFTPELDTWNTVMLNEPVYITGDEGLWFGYNSTISDESYPLGCDTNPAVNGFGNMINFQDVWATLTQYGIDGNWCIQGYIGYYPPTTAPTITFPFADNGDPVRNVAGYHLFRFYRGQEANETEWVPITNTPVTATMYQDPGWDDLDDATYRWAVKAVFNDGVISGPAFSNSVYKMNTPGTLTGTVRNNLNQTVAGATIICGDLTTTTNYSGAYFLQVPAGTYTVNATHVEHETFTQENVVVEAEQTTALNFSLNPVTTIIAEGFESFPDFAIEFDPWTLVDVDQGNTYGIEDVTWQNAHAPQAFIIFNPRTTTPPLTTLSPLAGNKMAVSFASVNMANNDWLITRGFKGAEELNFWARSLTDLHGLERFKVAVSTTGTDPASFTIISGNNYVEVPTQWTEYSYDLATYTQEHIWVAINCVSNDAMAFMVDNVRILGEEVSTDDNVSPIRTTTLHANYPNPFNPETTISFDLKDTQAVKLEIYNVKGQLVRTLINETKAAGSHSAVWTGTDDQNRPVASGIYYYKFTAGQYTSSKKMVLMK